MSRERGGLRGIISSLGDGEMVLFYEGASGLKRVGVPRKIASKECLSICKDAKDRVGIRVAKKQPGDVCSNCEHSKNCPGFPEGTL